MEKTEFLGFVGTYTKVKSEGIYSFILDTVEEKIKDIRLAAKEGNPTYVAISADKNYLYSVAAGDGEGGISAYRIDKDTGSLERMNQALTEGTSPCYVEANKAGDLVVASYYHRGTVEAHLVNEDGSLQPRSSFIQHEGSGPNKERQEKPHVHFSGFTPDGKYVIVVDLGTDQIVTYSSRNGELQKVASLSVQPGSGPRHIAFHPNGRFAYVMTELSNEVIVLAYDEETGRFTELQYISTIPAEFTENSQGAAIHVTKDGRFVYVSNRGHNSIAAFRIDESSGKVELVDYFSTEGNWPRDFVLDPTEQYVICANERSHNLVLYKRDQETGRLTVLQSDIEVPEPVCVKFSD